MTTYDVIGVARGIASDPHNRVRAVAVRGPRGARCIFTVATVLAMMHSGDGFRVIRGGTSTRLVAAENRGHRYVKTEDAAVPLEQLPRLS